MTTSILTLDTASVPFNTTNLCSFTTDCGCQYQTPISDYVVTPRYGVVSVIHRVIDIAQDALAAVKSAACSVGRKIKSAWNWGRTKVAQNFRCVKNGVRNMGRYVASKAAAGMIALKTGGILVKAYVGHQWNQAKTKTIHLYVSAKAKIVTTAIRFALWMAMRWNALRRSAYRVWILGLPYGIKIGRIAVVAAALYLIATAGLLACCVIVAALGVQTFDHLQKIGIIPRQHETLERKQKSFSLPA